MSPLPLASPLTSGRCLGGLQRTPVRLDAMAGPRPCMATAQHAHPPSHLPRVARRWMRCQSSETDTATATASPTSSSSPSESAPVPEPVPSKPASEEVPRIKRTMADLDALLGIKEEPPKPMMASASADADSRTAGDASASTSTAAKKPSTPGASSEMEDHIQKIIDKARKLADEQAAKGPSASSEVEQAQLKKEFESLLDNLTKPVETLSKDDIKRLKEAAFGPLTFWLTETRPIQEAEKTGLLIRGNLRDDRDKVFDNLCNKVKELFGGKYEVLMVEDTEGDEEGMSMRDVGPAAGAAGGPRGARMNLGPRVAFQIVPAAQAQPPQTDTLQRVASFILGLLVFGSTLELALASNITKLPKETLEYFANPNNLNSDQLPPGLDTWDPTSYIDCVIPLLGAVLAINLAHEAGHRVAGFTKDVKLGPSFFIPFGEIGSFGAITPFTSLLKNRQVMWDVASAGPLAGGALAAGLLVYGLAQSVGADPSDPEVVASMVKVPTQLFQGSLMLGGFTRLVLGEAALHGNFVMVSPYVIAGWCGLITTCLNLLPVGSLDGGRMVQAAYGRQALALSSFFTYVGLGLGLLGSSLALPFGLYVIICQRTAEKYIQDNVAPAGNTRMAVTATAVLAAILVLVPMAPELADAFGIGPSRF